MRILDVLVENFPWEFNQRLTYLAVFTGSLLGIICLMPVLGVKTKAATSPEVQEATELVVALENNTRYVVKKPRIFYDAFVSEK